MFFDSFALAMKAMFFFIKIIFGLIFRLIAHLLTRQNTHDTSEK